MLSSVCFVIFVCSFFFAYFYNDTLFMCIFFLFHFLFRLIRFAGEFALQFNAIRVTVRHKLPVCLYLRVCNPPFVHSIMQIETTIAMLLCRRDLDGFIPYRI